MTSSMLHVVLVDPAVSSPSDIGPDRVTALTAGIAAAGHRVTVLAGHSSDQRPEITDSVSLKRVLPPLIRRFGTPYDTRPAGGYGVRLFAALWGLESPDIVILRSPPIKGAFAAALFSALTGVPLVVDVRSIAPLNPTQGSVSKLIDRLRIKALQIKAKHVFAATPDIKTALEAQGFAADLVAVSPDGCDTTPPPNALDLAAVVLQKHPHLLRGPLAVYAGSLNRGRRVSDLLDVAAALKPLAPDVNILIVGDGPDRLDLNAFAARLDVLEKNVWFIPAQPRATVAGLLNAASLVFALPPQTQAGGLDAGSHVFEGLAANKPIAVMGDGWQRELIEGRQAGVALPRGNPDAAARELADFLRDGDLVRRAGEQAAALAHGKHNVARVIVEMRQMIEKIVVLNSRQDVMRARYTFTKRLFDVVVSAVTLVLLSPLLIFVSLAMLTAGWAPIAGRTRGGLRAKPFNLLTFDTMKAEHGRGPGQSEGWAYKMAHLLRRSAIDRLPELFNVLKGDMSLVGPRPLPAAYTAYYTETQLGRLDVRPGITGWAQVNGQQGLTWDEMFSHDLWYVSNRSFGLDLKILWKTFVGAFRGQRLAPLPAGQLPRFDEIEARRQGAEDA